MGRKTNKQNDAVMQYEKIRKDYLSVIASFNFDEKRLANKIRNIVCDRKYDIKKIEKIIKQIMVDENVDKNLLSKITPLILLQDDENPLDTYQYSDSRLRCDFLEMLLKNNLIDLNYLFLNGGTLFHILTVLDKKKYYH